MTSINQPDPSYLGKTTGADQSSPVVEPKSTQQPSTISPTTTGIAAQQMEKLQFIIDRTKELQGPDGKNMSYLKANKQAEAEAKVKFQDRPQEQSTKSVSKGMSPPSDQVEKANKVFEKNQQGAAQRIKSSQTGTKPAYLTRQKGQLFQHLNAKEAPRAEAMPKGDQAHVHQSGELSPTPKDQSPSTLDQQAIGNLRNNYQGKKPHNLSDNKPPEFKVGDQTYVVAKTNSGTVIQTKEDFTHRKRTGLFIPDDPKQDIIGSGNMEPFSKVLNLSTAAKKQSAPALDKQAVGALRDNYRGKKPHDLKDNKPPEFKVGDQTYVVAKTNSGTVIQTKEDFTHGKRTGLFIPDDPKQDIIGSGDQELFSKVLNLSLEAIKNKKHNNFSTEDINQWLFRGNNDKRFPKSQLAIKQGNVRKQQNSAPKASFSDVRMLGTGTYTGRIGIHNGGITDLRAPPGQRAAVGDSNNGDLLTGCGYAVATAVVNAAGPNLQRDLYNDYGVPGVMEVPEYGKQNYAATEGRGYALTLDSHDMKQSHNIEQVEFLTVPMHSVEGVRNMYAEAFEHAKDLDYIAMPMAGMSHPVLAGKPELSAQIVMEEFKKFIQRHPESKLKLVVTIWNDPATANLHEEQAKKL